VVSIREVMNGIMYVLSTGCQWRAIPKDLPPTSTVHQSDSAPMAVVWRGIVVLGAALTLGAALCFRAAAEPAMPPASPQGTEPGKAKLDDTPEIVFYVAKGDSNACGLGCDQWIAADGKIDTGAPQRLRRLVAKLGKRRLPIFFHSPGGSLVGSLELGRLIRQQRLVAGVARTIPRGCDPNNFYDRACQALKRSGMELMSEFDTEAVMCNSGCVYAMIGGTERLVPPWGSLGIHSIGRLGSNPKAGPLAPAALRLGNSKIDDFLREMGIDVRLRVEAAATPFNAVRMLHRDEFARFRIDTREFGETTWRYQEKPRPRVVKSFFVLTENEQVVHRSAILTFTCYEGGFTALGLAREVGTSEPTIEPSPLTVKGWGEKFDIVMRKADQPTVSGPRFDVAGSLLPNGWKELLGSGRDTETFEIVPKFSDKSRRWPASVMLAMSGFSAAYTKLRRACD
jgi:hypothetical protein